ncbi:PAN domain-containing protein [Thermodesulfobacteriota bacterium]
MKRSSVGILILCFCLFNDYITPANSQSIETNTDRPGLDYRSFDMPWDDVDICREACELDTKCKAWTYVKPNIQGPYSRCWLKHSVPNPRPNNCCASGVKSGQSFNKAAPSASPRNCNDLRTTYFKQCDEIKGYYAQLNCKTHGYSGCALDVVSCFTPFLPSHVFTDKACGRPGFIACATRVYDRHLACLRNCNENSIAGRLPQGLQKCLESCKMQIESELKSCP